MSGTKTEIAAELVRKARDGDEAALRALVEQAYPAVRRWALVRTGDPTEADDLTQDVLVQMIRKLPSFRGSSRFTTWLYTVTRNTATDRGRARRRRDHVAQEPRAYLELLPEPADDPARETERHQLRSALTVFFDELPERQREIFDLVELQGLTARETAGRLGIEPVSVRAHLFKARRRLRARILESRPELVEDYT